MLATGGGAFMNADTRAAIRVKGISIWLKADFDVLLRRVKRRTDRPLLQSDDPADTLRRLMEERYPVYAEADLTVESRDVPHDAIVDEILAALRQRLWPEPTRESMHDRAAAHQSEPIAVEVALGERSYTIAIGRGLLASLGARMAALRPGAKAAIVTDETVARHHLAATEAALEAAGIAAARVVVPAGRGLEVHARVRRRCARR